MCSFVKLSSWPGAAQLAVQEDLTPQGNKNSTKAALHRVSPEGQTSFRDYAVCARLSSQTPR